MNKKFCSLLCFMLILGAFIPVVSIAFAEKPDKGPLEKIVIIHHMNQNRHRRYAKPPWVPDKPDDEEEGQYKLLGKGIKWKTTEPIVIDPDYSGLDDDDVKRIIELSAEEWDEGAYSGWGKVPVDLFIGYSIVDYADVDLDTPDTRNEVLFGRIEDLFDDDSLGRVIAVTVIWGYFRGSPSQREIIEFDIMFDTDYTWGDAELEEDVMDLQNIATHELGHGAGLDDLYTSAASEETMYGYSIEGDIEKRDLYFGDIAGIQELYG